MLIPNMGTISNNFECLFVCFLNCLKEYKCQQHSIAMWRKLTPVLYWIFLTPFLIGPYHEMAICLANYDKALKMLHNKLAHMRLLLSYTHSD